MGFSEIFDTKPPREVTDFLWRLYFNKFNKFKWFLTFIPHKGVIFFCPQMGQRTDRFAGDRVIKPRLKSGQRSLIQQQRLGDLDFEDVKIIGK
jgi:hypothetical protein